VRSTIEEIEAVNDPTSESATDDLTIDVLAPCGEESCNHTGVSSSEFLEAFPQNLPEVGKLTLLRIHGVPLPGLLLRRCGNEQ
jgi:hypothetical protein